MGVSAARGSSSLDRDSAPALAELLRRSRFEVLPLDGIEDQVLEHLQKDTKVTVTTSPSRGLEAVHAQRGGANGAPAPADAEPAHPSVIYNATRGHVP
jgi:hypothetical protein